MREKSRFLNLSHARRANFGVVAYHCRSSISISWKLTKPGTAARREALRTIIARTWPAKDEP